MPPRRKPPAKTKKAPARKPPAKTKKAPARKAPAKKTKGTLKTRMPMHQKFL